MFPFSKIKEDNIPLADKVAQKEAKNKLDKYSRKSRVDGAYHWLNLIFSWFCVLAVIAVIGTIILNLLWKSWLTPEQQSKLNEFFVDGSIVALIGKRFAQIMENKEE